MDATIPETLAFFICSQTSEFDTMQKEDFSSH
jgi:hypothetical protein